MINSWWHGRRSAVARIALAVVGALVVQVGVADVAQALPLLAAAPQPHLGDPVHVNVVPVGRLPQRRKAPAYHATATAWPAASAAALPLGASAHKVAGVPVWGTAMPSVSGRAGGPSSLGVKVLGHTQAAAAGVNGVLAQVTPAGGAGDVRVGFDYSGYAQAYGGDYAQRLHLVELPACALTTPQVPACRVQKPLRSTNDAVAKSVSATVTLAAAASAPTSMATPHAAAATTATRGAMVLALTASTS